MLVGTRRGKDQFAVVLIKGDNFLEWNACHEGATDDRSGAGSNDQVEALADIQVGPSCTLGKSRSKAA